MYTNYDKKRFFKKITALALSAVLFGGIAGGTFYGVETALSSAETSQTEDSTSTLTATTVSYSSDSSDSSDSSSDSQSLDVTDIAAQGLTSVVSVTNISVQEVESYFNMFGRNGNGQGQTQLQETTSCGSGVIVYTDDTYLYIVTNYHVVEDATTLSITFVDDETYEAELCGYDESADIAMLKISISDLSSDTLSEISVAAIGSSDDLVVGEQVVAIGNALGYGQSVTTGIVSAVDRTISSEDSSDDTDDMDIASNATSNADSNTADSSDTASVTYIQTDAAINPGNSGGALFNMNGELIGINTAKVSSTDVEGMGYAIPISQILDLMESFISL